MNLRKLVARLDMRGKITGNYLAIFTLVYFAIVSIFMIRHGVFFRPDQFLVIGFVFALLVARPFTFLRDWLPFIALLLAYEYLRGIAPKLGAAVHVQPLIAADEALFGVVPSVYLQDVLYTPGSLRAYDYVATVAYMLHFVLPLAFGILLWLRDRRTFRRFSATLLVLSFAGFLTYVLYPAMPPWMAADRGLIPEVHDIFGATLGQFVTPGGVPTMYGLFSANPVAAMPSLHAAYPVLVYLFAVKVYGRRAHLFLPYVAIVWFAIVYLAHHWVVDALVGGLYALAAFAAVEAAQSVLRTRTQGRRAEERPEPVLVQEAGGATERPG